MRKIRFDEADVFSFTRTDSIRARRIRYDADVADSSLYIDASVWNCAFDEHVPDLLAQTTAFFIHLGSSLDCTPYLSDVVLQELAYASADRQGRLGELLGRIRPIRLDLDDESAALADAYIEHGVLTAGHKNDARHVAIASVAEVDAIVSWNYRHLVNRRRRDAFNGVNAIKGYNAIEIISPPEVFDV